MDKTKDSEEAGCQNGKWFLKTRLVISNDGRIIKIGVKITKTDDDN